MCPHAPETQIGQVQVAFFNHATGLPLFQYSSVQLTYLYGCLCFLFTCCRVVQGA